MVNALITVAVGLVTFIVVGELVTTLVTGTDTGAVLIQNLLGLAVAVGVVIAALTILLKGGEGT